MIRKTAGAVLLLANRQRLCYNEISPLGGCGLRMKKVVKIL